MQWEEILLTSNQMLKITESVCAAGIVRTQTQFESASEKICLMTILSGRDEAHLDDVECPQR